MKQLLREPLLHFLLLGGLAFAVFYSLEDTPVEATGTSIEVTDEVVQSLARQFEGTWKRPPAESELAALVDNHIEEEILIREALLLGLDRDDTVIRQRLVLKMRFLLEAGAVEEEPDRQMLQQHLEANAATFQSAPLVSFEQVWLMKTAEEPAEVLQKLRAGADPAIFVTGSMLPPRMQNAPPQSVDAVFGRGFFTDVAALAEGDWAGPVQSGFGQHFVRVTAVQPGRLPALDEIENQVLQHWKAAQTEKIADTRLQNLRSRYEITTGTDAEGKG